MSADTAYPVRKALSFTAEQWERIQEFRFEHRIPTEAEAVRRLLDRGLAHSGKPKEQQRPDVARAS